jgi:hypothetical protein
MIRGAKVGDRVRCVWGAYATYDSEDNVVAEFAEGNTGTVVRVKRYSKVVYIAVEPDPPGFGRVMLRPSELVRLKDD